MFKTTAIVFVAIAILGCNPSDPGEQPGAVTPAATVPKMVEIKCDEQNGVKPVCGFTNPEDLAVVPGGKLLLVSEMGAFMSDAPNTMSLLDVEQNQRLSIEFNWENTSERWGDPACAAPEPEKFSPHGIDLMTRSDGRHKVLVVNHGNEQVEFFELVNTDEAWHLNWKGCAKPEGDPFMNDVASLNDGGFS